MLNETFHVNFALSYATHSALSKPQFDFIKCRTGPDLYAVIPLNSTELTL